MPTISVIATVLNEAETIDRLIASLEAQSPPVEDVVIVDGGSTDGTWEKLEAHAQRWPTLRAIRDESCNLKNSPGPIARGRNVAIRAARGEWIACCDAGCDYAPDWLANVTSPLLKGNEYSLGGSCIDPAMATAWDIAAAPLMGIATVSQGMRKSCTARSMAFTKSMWQRAGGFPEQSLLGEDTLFDLSMQRLTRAEYAENAMAIYRPRFTFASAAATLARYSAADGALGLRKSRLARMLARCAAQVAGVTLLPWSWIPLAVVGVVELVIAFERDRSVLRPAAWRALIPRVVFSIAVPWVSAFHYLRGMSGHANRPNRQNVSR